MSEPVALVVLLVTWLAMTMFGFTLVNWGIGTGSFPTAFSEAGSSVFTLGFTLTHTQGSRTVDFVAAGTGMVLVALQIAYLPTLYAAYNRRETLVTLLESRAGSPAWGPELLIRHQLVGTIDNLANLFAEWERWAADVAESHSTYPSLLYLRSPRALNSWIVSLIAVLGRGRAHARHGPRRRPHRGPHVHPHGIHLPARHRPGHPHPLRPGPRARQSHRPRRGEPSTRPTTDWWPWDCRRRVPSTRRGPTSGAGGSTTSRWPTTWPTGSTRRRPGGPAPAARSGRSRWSRCARRTASPRRSRPGPVGSPPRRNTARTAPSSDAGHPRRNPWSVLPAGIDVASSCRSQPGGTGDRGRGPRLRGTSLRRRPMLRSR